MKYASVVFDEDRVVPVVECKDKSLTQQSALDECDINKIVKKFEQSGMLTHVSAKVAQYGDFSNAPDYAGAMRLVKSAEDMFMALPASVRERFDNDPERMVAFVGDPQNRAEAAKMGLLRGEVLESGITPVLSGSAPEGANPGSTGASTPATAPK